MCPRGGGSSQPEGDTWVLSREKAQGRNHWRGRSPRAFQSPSFWVRARHPTFTRLVPSGRICLSGPLTLHSSSVNALLVAALGLGGALVRVRPPLRGGTLLVSSPRAASEATKPWHGPRQCCLGQPRRHFVSPRWPGPGPWSTEEEPMGKGTA